MRAGIALAQRELHLRLQAVECERIGHRVAADVHYPHDQRLPGPELKGPALEPQSHNRRPLTRESESMLASIVASSTTFACGIRPRAYHSTPPSRKHPLLANTPFS